MKLTIILSVIGLVLFSLVYYFTGYRSAFEADQQCHYEITQRNTNTSSFGCDHDLETRQWILFEEADNYQPAKVAARFRY